MPEDAGESPQKYVYKLKFDPKESKKNDFGEVDQGELQNYINGLLGVPHAKDPEAGN
jgi:hypothetical protein